MGDDVVDAPAPPSPSKGVGLSNWLVRTATGFLSSKTTRRGFLVRSALTGSAFAVAGCSFAGKRGGAYQRITECPPGALCRDGYTEFCCSINGGYNSCPPNSIPAGWWRADYSEWCNGTRYYVDCNEVCCGPRQGAFCAGCVECTCGPTCNHRKVYCNYFRYGQCHQEVAAVGPIACRLSLCTPPYEIDASCSPASAVDNATAGHITDCLLTGPPPPPPPAPPAVLPTSCAAAATAVGTVVVVARATDGVVHMRRLASGGWSDWSSLGGSTTSGIVAVRDGSGIRIFVRGPDYAFWTLFISNAGVPSGWASLGGVFTSDPAAAPEGGSIRVVGRGTDYAFYSNLVTGGAASGWSSLGGFFNSDPAVASEGGGVRVFGRSGDYAMYHAFVAGGTSSGWAGMGGVFSSDPGAVSEGSGARVFGRGADNALWTAFVSGGSSTNFYSLEGVMDSDPSPASAPAGTFAFIRAADAGLWYRVVSTSTLGPFETLGGVITANPVGVYDGASMFLFARASDAALWYQVLSSGSWSGWQSLGGVLDPVRGAN